MQTIPRGRNALARVSYPPPPPPIRIVKNADEKQLAALEAVDPKWLEDEVLRILRKHAIVPAAPVAAESVWVDDDDLQPTPSSRFWRYLHVLLVLALVVGAAAAAARWRYPAKTAALVSAARGVVARVMPPAPWRATPVPLAPAQPTPTPISPTVPALTAPAPTVPSPSAPAQPAQTTSLTGLAPLATAEPPAAPRAPSPHPAAPAPKDDPKVYARATHALHDAPVAAPATAALPESPSPLPGSLGEAIRRAGGTVATPPAPDHLASHESKPPSDPTLPERPSASLVQNALLAALPEARACMRGGDETKAIVVFESSGAVSSVQADGASAGCVQKAFSHARVPPFSQPTYRAGVPVRAN